MTLAACFRQAALRSITFWSAGVRSGDSSSELVDTELVADFDRVSFGGAIFSDASFAGADFIFEGAGFDGVDLDDADFEGSDFAVEDFEEAVLDVEDLDETFGPVLSLIGVGFENKDLGGAVLEAVDGDGAEASTGAGLAADALDVGVGGAIFEDATVGFTVADLLAVFWIVDGVADGAWGGVSTGTWPPLRNAWARSRTLGNIIWYCSSVGRSVVRGMQATTAERVLLCTTTRREKKRMLILRQRA